MRNRLKRLEGRGQGKTVELWIAEGTSDVYEYQASEGGPVQQATLEELDGMATLRRVIIAISGVIEDTDEYGHPEELVL